MKYMVRLQHTNNNMNTIFIIYARNNEKLEKFMNKWLKDIIEKGTIDGYEYQPITGTSKRFQHRHDFPSWVMCGNWVGADFIDGSEN